jgi:amino acid adenylation domain-containing protein
MQPNKPKPTTADLSQRTSRLSPAKQVLLEKLRRGQFISHTSGITRRPDYVATPLSFPQQRQWFLEMLTPGTSVNHLVYCLQLTGVLDIATLEQSINQIIKRHEILRTGFEIVKGSPTPYITPTLKLPLSVVNLQELPLTERKREALRLAHREVLQPFDLTQPPLFRVKLFLLSSEDYILLLLVHHTIGDGWSLGIFLREWLTLYNAITAGLPAELPTMPLQYADFAHWQRQSLQGAALEKHLSYWRKQLGGELPVLTLPLDRPRPARQTFRGHACRGMLSSGLTEALKEVSRQENVSLFMTLLTAFQILLCRYSGQEDIIVGSPIANRNQPEFEGVIGPFLNILAMRTDLSEDPTFREALRRVRDVTLAAYAHQDIPFEKIVEELQPERSLSRMPLFQAMLILQNFPQPELELPGLTIHPLTIDRGTAQFDLTMIILEGGDELVVTVEYNSDVFEPATVASMLDAFRALLEDAVSHPDRRLSWLNILSESERRRMITWNQTQMDYPQDMCVHELFEQQVRRTPDEVAVVCRGRPLTYRELDRRANQVAHTIEQLGVGPEIRVGICLERSLELVVGLLAVLKAGGAYVPVDPSHPVERIVFMLKDAGVQVLLMSEGVEMPLKDLGAAVVRLSEQPLSNEEGQQNSKRKVAPENLAYIIYTSGSTGQPKGVQIPHRALTNFLWSMRQRPGLKAGDVVLAMTSVSFDIAALELYLPLVVGAKVVIVNREVAMNVRRLERAIIDHGVNTIQATPSAWQMMMAAGWKGASHLTILCGGETLSRKLADRLLERVGKLWNMYGPTETTIWSAAGEVARADGPIAIGRPIGNTQIYILDEHLQLVPVGISGEMYIGGVGVARGYLNRAGLTDDKFIPDPFSTAPGAHLYKTGDKARHLPDGSIEFLGRVDNQVKIRGFRIELGEIEEVLQSHPSVREAVVLARTDLPGDIYLVAYFVSQTGPVPPADELCAFLKAKLPSYLVPAVFLHLDALPLTPNHKVDRKALPIPNASHPRPTKAFEAPRTPLEELLATIYAQVLGIDKVGIYDNFFDMGGASIQSIEIISRAQGAGIHIMPELLFEHQTVASVAAALQGHIPNTT